MTAGCFFCGNVADDLYVASTFMIDRRVRECELELQDTVLLAKLSAGDLISLEAKKYLAQLGVVMEGMINTTHLNNWILAVIADLQEHKQGRFILLIFNEDVGEVLKEATSDSLDDEGIIIAKAAKIIRRHMLDTKNSLTGYSMTDVNMNQFHSLFFSLVRMILSGPYIETHGSLSEE
ncbi:unnamed protein product [Mytilus coruscus]|uniref:Uncharacterized protein n=1 Tax=Mytilus coruscus TaxID=42192 RepID=A0A6J8CCR7_MYTCO|nr:unnamed protein product [Mytilus coruscus]